MKTAQKRLDGNLGANERSGLARMVRSGDFDLGGYRNIDKQSLSVLHSPSAVQLCRIHL